VKGSSFLWHQIRCVVAVLLVIGQGKEEVTLIDDLLNIEKYPQKPQYTIASETPLVLFDCQYNDIQWRFDKNEIIKLIRHFQALWLDYQTKATIIKSMINNLQSDYNEKVDDESTSSSSKNDNDCSLSLIQPYSSLQGKSQSQTHFKFSERLTANSLQSRVQHYVKRRRLDEEVYDKITFADQYLNNKNVENDKEKKSDQQIETEKETI
jgi:tRNA pseudouridine38/39 synthase